MKFLLTKELGRLAKWLRILGFDSEYWPNGPCGSLIIKALREERVIVSRNTKLPRSRGLKIVLIKSERIKDQLRELVESLKISPEPEAMFSRCTICNIGLVDVEKQKVEGRVPVYVLRTRSKFFICPKCSRVYWRGTHWGNAQDTLNTIRA